MSEWSGVTSKARRINAKPRVLKPKENGITNEDNFRELSDRLPRPGAVGIVAKPKIKQGMEISAAQMAELKFGVMRIDARLDLHGLTQAQAFRELGHFMQKQITRRARLLLIITGKGKDMQGVLRQQLPGWLMTGEWKPYVLTIHPAHQKHGGDGATYVLLRRQVK